MSHKSEELLWLKKEKKKTAFDYVFQVECVLPSTVKDKFVSTDYLIQCSEVYLDIVINHFEPKTKKETI